MWLRWLPWKFVVRRLARSHGLIDPIAILSHVERFAQPSEVAVPIELLRAGVVFHSRGFINSRVIQQNLDWVWPWWIHRQFDPASEAFIPRAFTLTHVNLTSRNWTAVGVPGCDAFPIVDPRGLLTPFWDSWSLDAWVVAEDGRALIPSRLDRVEQRLDFEQGLAVVTSSRLDDLELLSRAEVVERSGPVCRLSLRARAGSRAWLVISARPYNPEGISFIHRISLDEGMTQWLVNRRHTVRFQERADLYAASDYMRGDVKDHLFDSAHSIVCEVGMATAAALFEIGPSGSREAVVETPLVPRLPSLATITGKRLFRRCAPRNDAHGRCMSLRAQRSNLRLWSWNLRNVVLEPKGVWAEAPCPSRGGSWEAELKEACRIHIPDQRMQFLYDAALRTLVLLSPDDVYPGPFTYKRFWFRDAAFILHAMLCAGLFRRAARAIERFFPRQKAGGFFRSQEGEWDSNGEVLWLLRRYCELTGQGPLRNWVRPVHSAARWILRKRLPDAGNAAHAGLMPAGFSAEHLGPNDYYYWDDFWSVTGLTSAAWILSRLGKRRRAGRLEREADDLMAAIDRSLRFVQGRLGSQAMPASCYRRLDSGAVGSLVAGYPLQLLAPHDQRLLATVNYLMDCCRVRGGFFQDMIHSGINAYLTLHMAQVLLRAGDGRFSDLVHAVADLASPTGQWPEAIHPHTLGGCMGDGQHAWAAAEWVVMIRNCFVYEEMHTPRLILGAGILPEWLGRPGRISIGWAPTSWGPVRLSLDRSDGKIQVRWEAGWFAEPPEIELRLPGTTPVHIHDDRREVQVPCLCD